MPKRIQLKRVKGWRIPPNTVSVTRPGKYGNPFTVKEYGDRAIITYKQCLREMLIADPDFLVPLRGKDLACFCPLDAECHGDWLLFMANLPQKQ